MHPVRQLFNAAASTFESELKKYCIQQGKQRLERQSINFPEFNTVAAAALEPLWNGYASDAIPGIFAMGYTDRQECFQSNEVPEEQTENLRKMGLRLQHCAPFLNGVASVCTPNPNFEEAVASMKLPSKKVLDNFLTEDTTAQYVVTINNPELLDILPTDKLKGNAENYKALLLCRVYNSDLLNHNPNHFALTNIPLEILGLFPDGKKTIGQRLINLMSWYTFMREPGIYIDWYICAVDTTDTSRVIDIFSSRPAEVGELYTEKGRSKRDASTAKVETFVVNLILQMMSNGSATQTSTIVNTTGMIINPAEGLASIKRTKRKEKRRTNIPIQELRLVPDISLKKVKEAEAKRHGDRVFTARWVTAHFQSFWRGSGKDRHLGLPQLVQGYFCDGTKAKAKRERQAKRLEKLNQEETR